MLLSVLILTRWMSIAQCGGIVSKFAFKHRKDEIFFITFSILVKTVPTYYENDQTDGLSVTGNILLLIFLFLLFFKNYLQYGGILHYIYFIL